MCPASVTVGIEALGFASSHYCIPLTDLAAARGVAPERFTTALGQELMAVPPPGEDIVTLGANAAADALAAAAPGGIDMLLFATESAVDQAKAAGMFVHGLLDLPTRCRVLELKQACYAAAGGGRYGRGH